MSLVRSNLLLTGSPESEVLETNISIHKLSFILILSEIFDIKAATVCINTSVIYLLQ